MKKSKNVSGALRILKDVLVTMSQWQFPITVTKRLSRTTYEKERFVLAHGFTDFSPWSVALVLWTCHSWHFMMESHDRKEVGHVIVN